MANFEPCVLMLNTEVESRGDLAAAILEAGFEVRRESSGGGGIAQVLEVDPDVILMSQDMPPLDGVPMLSLLRRMTMAPIIVVGIYDAIRLRRHAAIVLNDGRSAHQLLSLWRPGPSQPTRRLRHPPGLQHTGRKAGYGLTHASRGSLAQGKGTVITQRTR